MNSAWNLVQAGDETADGFQILDYLAYSISQEGNHEQARNITLLLHENYPENTRYIDNIKYYDELEDVIHRPSSVSPKTKFLECLVTLCHHGPPDRQFGLDGSSLWSE